MTTDAPHAIVLGLSPTGLYAVRELARAGIRVVGADAVPTAGAASRLLAQPAWRIADDEELCDLLLAYAASTDVPPVLIPTSDRYIEVIIRHAARLAPHLRFAAAYGGIAAELLDKARFHALCARHRVEMPAMWLLEDGAELAPLLRRVRYPCLLKPQLIHRARAFLRGHKVLVAATPEALTKHVARLPAGVGGWTVQEIIPGAESRITVFAGCFGADGTATQLFTARKLRQYPAGFGSASLAYSTVCTETRERSQNFLRAIGFAGLCGTEFKRDPRDGRLKMIEINPRPTLWFQLAHDSGKRLALAHYCELAGLAPPPDPPQRDGVLWRYALKDFATKLFYARRPRGFAFPPPDVDVRPVRARSWPVYDRRDPLPALVEPWLYVAKFLRRRT
jgi:predicted ATP-grasp superfamily ATP-dependent carboligase